MTFEQALTVVVLGSLAIGMWITARLPRTIARSLDRANGYPGTPKDSRSVKRNGH